MFCPTEPIENLTVNEVRQFTVSDTVPCKSRIVDIYSYCE